MSNFNSIALSMLAAATLSCSTAEAEELALSSAPLAVPPDIAVPAGQHQTFEAHAVGFQIYECKADATGKLGWALRAPAALLFDADDRLVAAHFGGIDVGLPAGPYWLSTRDGSRVHGGNAISAPNPGSIPLLRLTALDTAGEGIFADTSFIHRLGTVGGVAPSSGCRRAGLRLPVYYEAEYVMYAADLARPEVPATIAVAAGHGDGHVFHAEGVQIFECVSGLWTFRAPRATLFDASGDVVATHFGGVDVGLPAGPYWRSTRDGSRVHGGNAVSSPNPGAIPLLRLDAVDTAGTGIFTHVSFIQRLATVGGVGPTGPCLTPAERVEVPYESDYAFYYQNAQ
jgi:hypothetical protein